MKTSNIKNTFYIIAFISIFGCKTKLNQTIDKQKEGQWIQYDTLEYIYKVVGKYHKNEEIGTWRYYYNNKLVRKEKYNKNICKTKFYHSNGKLLKKGYTKLETKNNILHWFYFGNWKFYDSTRIFIKKVEYVNGKTKDSINANYSEIKMNFTSKK